MMEIPGQRILVCALDWGLGHATRTGQLVRRWRERGARITLASNGRSAALWAREFPDLPLRELPDYAISYAPGPLLVPRLLLSLPRLSGVRSAEEAVVGSWSRDFDACLSDNRFGCRLPGKPSLFLTHQLHLAAPRGLEIGETLAEHLMARLLRPFDRILVPDHPGTGLSGRLGHPRRADLFPPITWIGPLSRFADLAPAPSPWSGPWDTLALVSGPEPARTGFEDALRRHLHRRPGRHLLVRGLPHLAPASPPDPGPGLREAPHLDTPDLASALRGAAEIVTRGGYSTLMDLDALGRLDASVLLVPTPGQTEQEYLADHLGRVRGVRSLPQRRFPSPPGNAPSPRAEPLPPRV